MLFSERDRQSAATQSGRTRRAALLLIASLGLLIAAAGCSKTVQTVFSTDNGCLFSGFDVLVAHGEEAAVRVRLQSGKFLRDRPNALVRFSVDNYQPREVVTDDEGYATISFRPPAPGNYVVRAEVLPCEACKVQPSPIEVLVACRRANTSVVIVDLDKTIVASGFKKVLVGDPPPMPRSPEVMNRLAGDYTIIYLTHRLEYLGVKSKAWLQSHGYPRAPTLMADLYGLMQGSATFKTEVVDQIRRRFTGRMIGIGDRLSDALAYRANAAEAILLVPGKESDDAQALKDRAQSLNQVPDDVRVVASWNEIEQIFYQSARFSRSDFQSNLLARADELLRARPQAAGDH
jgi:hypothetical protein